MKDPLDEVDALQDRSARHFSQLMAAAQVARLRGDERRADQLVAQLGRDLGALMAAADLLGRRRLLLELRAEGLGPEVSTELEIENQRGLNFQAVPFVEAAQAILERWPVLAPGWEATRDAWLQTGFAMARSNDLKVTMNVQRTFVSMLRGNPSLTSDAVVQAIQSNLEAGESSITRAYADTVFRTVVNSAYTEGRRKQAERPAVRRAASGWRYNATNDSNVRENHWAGEDFIAHVDDPVWDTHAPPNGFNCRCALEIVPTSEMEALGLSDSEGNPLRRREAPAGFVPDPGFKSGAR